MSFLLPAVACGTIQRLCTPRVGSCGCSVGFDYFIRSMTQLRFEVCSLIQAYEGLLLPKAKRSAFQIMLGCLPFSAGTLKALAI